MNINKNETKQQINYSSQIQRQLDQTGNNNYEQKSNVTFEVRSPLFSYENNQLLDVEDPLSMNVTNGFEQIHCRNGDHFIISPKSIDKILLDSNPRNKSSSIQNHIAPIFNQYQSQRQRQSKLIAHNLCNESYDKSNSNQQNIGHFIGDQSSIIKHSTQNQSVFDNRHDASCDGISDLNDRSKIRQTKCSQIEGVIPKGIEFLVLRNVQKFIVKMKKKSRSLLFKSLSKPQFKLINDLSTNYNYYMKNGYFNLKVIFGIKLIIYFLTKFKYTI